MAGEIAGGIAALRGATDIVLGLMATRELKNHGASLIELQTRIMTGIAENTALHNQIAALQNEKRELEKTIMEHENWKAEAERYQLHDFGGETFAYVPKPGMENGEPRHYLCANCLPNRQKSILQRISSSGVYECHGCKVRLQLGREDRGRSSYRSHSGDDGGWMGA